MNQGLHCDWLLKQPWWSCLAHLGLHSVFHKNNFLENHIINPLWTKLVQSRWLDIGLNFFFTNLWTSTPSLSISMQKKNLANFQPSWPHTWSIDPYYYMASSMSGQDEPNRVLWLATQAPSCSLGTTRCIPQAKFHQKPYNKSFIDQVCSVKMAGYWPHSFLGVYAPRLRLGP